ncbi:MAG TPA: hypothetical protein VN680_04015 [Burkholderiaceae bacterium]|jgi:hypothetical protein|nr:hypothetical protein [Burkholderiaceae bacterium]
MEIDMLTSPRVRPPGRPSSSRVESLRASLPGVVDALRRHRADLIEESLIAECVALDWLEWHGGALRLTITGKNVCAGAGGSV